MTYGLLIRNEDNDIVLDDKNSAVIVHEQGSLSSQTLGSITSTYNDMGGKWFGGSTVPGGTQRRNWSSNYPLTQEYQHPPIVAMRCGYNVKLPQCEVYSYNPTTTGYYNHVRFRHENPTSTQFIVCADAASAPASAKSLGGETFGIQIKDDSSPQQDIFDSRWASIVAATGVHDYPAVTSSSGLFTFNSSQFLLNPPSVTQNTVSSQTIVSTPGAFIAPTFSGFVKFYNINFDISGGENQNPPNNWCGGGYFVPGIKQTNATTIANTSMRYSVNSVDGAGTLGAIVTSNGGSYASLKGSYIVLRYMGYT